MATLASFSAAGQGGLAIAPRLDGNPLSGFHAAGRGGVAFTPAPGARASGFVARGRGGMQAWPVAELDSGSLFFRGAGGLLIVQRVGGDDLDPVGPNLSLSDPLRIGVSLLASVELLPPDDWETTAYPEDAESSPYEQYTQTFGDGDE